MHDLFTFQIQIRSFILFYFNGRCQFTFWAGQRHGASHLLLAPVVLGHPDATPVPASLFLFLSYLLRRCSQISAPSHVHCNYCCSDFRLGLIKRKMTLVYRCKLCTVRQLSFSKRYFLS